MCVWFGDYHKFLYTTHKDMWWSSTLVLCFGLKVQQTYGITPQSHMSETIWGLFFKFGIIIYTCIRHCHYVREIIYV